MFDVGFSELVVIALVALIVIGPERLPKVARTLGHLFGRMQRYVNDVKADIAREVQLDELRKFQKEMEDTAHAVTQSVSKEFDSARTAVESVAASAKEAVAISPAADPQAPPAVTSPDADPQAAPIATKPLTDIQVPPAATNATTAPQVAEQNAEVNSAQLELPLTKRDSTSTQA